MDIIINCDMGEGFGLYKIGNDEEMMKFISVANVACGFHASDPNHMKKTVRMAKENSVKVGAHPSLPDLQGFGRREMKIDRDELANIIVYQVGALQGFLQAEEMKLNHIQPHGSLYGMAARMEHVAHAICDAADVFQVPLFGMANTLHEKVYTERNHQFLSEYYADLFYDSTGQLIITMEHDPVDPKDAAERAIRAVKEGKTSSVDGVDIAVRADCICVHSDTPNAVEVVSAVKSAVQSYV